MLPIIRTFISLPAGVARMPFWRFTVLTALGCLPWVFMLTFIGKQAGDNWEQWKDNLHYVDYAVAAAIVLGVVWLRRAPAARRRGRCRPPMRRAETARARAAAGPGGAAADLLVRPRRAAAVAARLGHAALPGDARKEVEVALHAGTALALALLERRAPPRLGADRRHGAARARRRWCSSAPIEERLGAPPTIAAGPARRRGRDGCRRPHAARAARRARRDAGATRCGSAPPRRSR